MAKKRRGEKSRGQKTPWRKNAVAKKRRGEKTPWRKKLWLEATVAEQHGGVWRGYRRRETARRV